MKIDGCVALVVESDSLVGAAIVRSLLARDAAKVYAAVSCHGSRPVQPGVVTIAVDTSRPQHARALARQLADVNLLINSMGAAQHSDESQGGAANELLERESQPGHTLDLIEAFAPVLAANGGGALVNVLSVLSVDHATGDTTARALLRAMQEAQADGLRDRLAAQQTQVLNFRAQLAVGNGDPELDHRRTLADHLAMRVLDQLEAADSSSRADGTNWFDEAPLPPRTGRRGSTHHND
jgi:NAD(P)-dependent dehydrogenase (short-subunit alcohol dehydrogenase family)